MKRGIARAAAALACAALLFGAAPVRIPQADIDAENARWTALGVKLPAGGIVLPEPFSPPYSSRSFVVPSQWYRRFADALKADNGYTVEASALRADLPILKLLMSKTYAGYATAQQHSNWNWNAWFSAWDASLAKRGAQRMPLAQAFAPWGKLQGVQADNHSGIPGFDRFSSGSQSAQLAHRPAGACTALFASRGTFTLVRSDKGQQPHAVQLWSGSAFSSGSYVSFPKRDGTPRALECSGARIALTPVAAAAAPSTASYETLADGIGYVRLPAFNDTAVEALRASLAKAQNLGKERAVVLDLRANPGGSAPVDVLSNWFAQSAVDQASQFRQIGTQSCFRNALFFGSQQQLAYNLKPPVSAGATQFLQQIVDVLKEPGACAVSPQIMQGLSALSDHRFTRASNAEGQTRIIAVLDGGCTNECEFLAAVLAGLPGTVLAGSSTYGVTGFSQPGYFMLPHSRIAFRLALARTDPYGDGRSVDGYGIAVDVLLPGENAQSRNSLLALARAVL
ncbi:MAG: S41 family peptidase [Candidatus Baltobacteraceae bacterium]